MVAPSEGGARSERQVGRSGRDVRWWEVWGQEGDVGCVSQVVGGGPGQRQAPEDADHRPGRRDVVPSSRRRLECVVRVSRRARQTVPMPAMPAAAVIEGLVAHVTTSAGRPPGRTRLEHGDAGLPHPHLVGVGVSPAGRGQVGQRGADFRRRSFDTIPTTMPCACAHRTSSSAPSRGLGVPFVRQRGRTAGGLSRIAARTDRQIRAHEVAPQRLGPPHRTGGRGRREWSASAPGAGPSRCASRPGRLLRDRVTARPQVNEPDP